MAYYCQCKTIHKSTNPPYHLTKVDKEERCISCKYYAYRSDLDPSEIRKVFSSSDGGKKTKNMRPTKKDDRVYTHKNNPRYNRWYNKAYKRNVPVPSVIGKLHLEKDDTFINELLKRWVNYNNTSNETTNTKWIKFREMESL